MKQGRTAQLREDIEHDIVTGVYAPGQRLDETALATRFNVSRTPIRQALQQLAAMGFIVNIPKRGSFVSEVSISEMLCMFEVMAELEGMCAKLAARRITDEQLDQLEAAQAQCNKSIEAGNADDYYYANERFHMLLYKISGNPFLEQTAGQLHNRLKPYRRLQLRVSGRLKMSASEHEAIIDALRDGDPKTAELVTEQHILIQGDKFSDFLAALEQWKPTETTIAP